MRGIVVVAVMVLAGCGDALGTRGDDCEHCLSDGRRCPDGTVLRVEAHPQGGTSEGCVNPAIPEPFNDDGPWLWRRDDGTLEQSGCFDRAAGGLASNWFYDASGEPFHLLCPVDGSLVQVWGREWGEPPPECACESPRCPC